MKRINPLPFFRIACFLLIGLLLNNCESPKNSTTNSDEYFYDFESELVAKLDSLNPDSAILIIRELLSIDSIKENPPYHFSLIGDIGVYKARNGEIDSSVFFLSEAINFWETDSSTQGRKHHASMLYCTAYAYYYKGENDSAISYFEKSVAISEKIGANNITVNANLTLSSVYESMGDYGKAIDCIENTIQLCHNTNDSVSMISALSAYANLYSNCYLFEESLTQFNDLLKYKKHFTPYFKFCYYNNLGRMFYLKGDYFKAKPEFINALEFVSKNDMFNYLIVVFNLAETSLLLNNADSAKIYLDILQQDCKSIAGFPLMIFSFYSLQGEYYCLKGQNKLAQKSFAVADSIKEQHEIDKVILMSHYKREARFFSTIGQYQDAYEKLHDFNDLSKSVLEENNMKQVAGLKYKFQRDTTIISQRNDITLNQHKIQTYKYRQYFFIAGIIVLLLFVALIILYFRKVRALNYEKSLRQIAGLKMENVRSRISPHFVFNVLNNIWAIIDDRENAKIQFDNLVNLIRRSLINTETIAIPLADEIDFVKSFLELEKLRMSDNLQVKWNIEKGVDMNLHVPGMILQIPVENAIKHGLAPKKDNRILTITISAETEFLRFVIADNGVGFQQGTSSSKGTGTGLRVLTNTIHILNQTNENKMTYEIQNLDDEGLSGTKVVIEIPTSYNYNLNG